MVGQTISHYRIVERIGAGGMGEVYRAHDEHLDRDVAIKVLPPGTLGDESARKRFHKEALALSKLNHPNIATIHDFDTQQGVDFLVMEYIPGITLSEKLANRPLPENEIVALGVQLAEGLSAAHEQGVIHRDLKPGNLRVTSDGRLKILDFGLARLRLPMTAGAPTESLSGTQAVAGTLPYMSPEQLRGDAVDARSDIWSLGIVLYEMATGELPFVGPTTTAIADAILHRTPRPASSLNAAVPPALEQVIARLLEKDRRDRYGSAQDLVLDLRRIMRGRETGSSWLINPRQTLRRFASRTKRRLNAVGIALVVVAVAIFATARWHQAQRINTITAELRTLADAGNFDAVQDRLHAAGLDIRDSRLVQLASVASGRLALETDPPGALVAVRRVTPIQSFSDHSLVSLGRTPTSPQLLVSGEYLVRLSASDHTTLALLVDIPRGGDVTLRRKLVPDAGPAPMVFVDGGTSALMKRGYIPAFLIGQREITNAEYQKFVVAGGYRDPQYWPLEVIVKGRRISWRAAMQAFTDRTGLPGPRSWQNGSYPEGQAQYPVTGVNWYEAAAFAKWAGASLPTTEQWWRAAINDTSVVFPWGNDVKTTDLRANFSLTGPRPVASYPLGVSPFGCYDMAGNVREWLRDPDPSGHPIAVGGSWQDPAYMFEAGHAESFDPDFASDSVGFRMAELAGK